SSGTSWQLVPTKIGLGVIAGASKEGDDWRAFLGHDGVRWLPGRAGSGSALAAAARPAVTSWSGYFEQNSGPWHSANIGNGSACRRSPAAPGIGSGTKKTWTN